MPGHIYILFTSSWKSLSKLYKALNVDANTYKKCSGFRGWCGFWFFWWLFVGLVLVGVFLFGVVFFLPRTLFWSQNFVLPQLEKPVPSFIFHFNLRLKNSIFVEQPRLPLNMLLLYFATEGVYIAAVRLRSPHKEAMVWILATSQKYSILFNQCVKVYNRCGFPCKALKCTDHWSDFPIFLPQTPQEYAHNIQKLGWEPKCCRCRDLTTKRKENSMVGRELLKYSMLGPLK